MIELLEIKKNWDKWGLSTAENEKIKNRKITEDTKNTQNWITRMIQNVNRISLERARYKAKIQERIKDIQKFRGMETYHPYGKLMSK